MGETIELEADGAGADADADAGADGEAKEADGDGEPTTTEGAEGLGVVGPQPTANRVMVRSSAPKHAGRGPSMGGIVARGRASTARPRDSVS